MSIAAIVPVKRLSDAKGRLSAVLTPSEREEVTLCMLGGVLRALDHSDAVHTVYVVTPDDRVAERARERGAIPVRDDGHDLNVALRLATDVAVRDGAHACLIVFGDLLLLTANEVAEMVACAQRANACVIAPARSDTGTNALYLNPPIVLPFLFGAESFLRYVETAREHGVPLEIYRSVGTGYDLDRPTDLDEIRDSPEHTEFRAPLKRALEAACRE